MDVSHRALEIAARACASTGCPTRSASASSCCTARSTYRDARLAGFDAAAVVEVIEHLDPPRLAAFERVRLRVRPAGDGRRDDAEPRVQRALRGAAGRAVPPPRPPLRVDARRVPGVGGAASPAASATRVRFVPVGAGRPGGRRADADGGVRRDERDRARSRFPSSALVVLIGASGSGKSTFARTHFMPTEVLSSDFCRGLVADDENDQAATERRLRRAPLHRRQAARGRRG